jgi:hypothetical protein
MRNPNHGGSILFGRRLRKEKACGNIRVPTARNVNAFFVKATTNPRFLSSGAFLGFLPFPRWLLMIWY